MAKKSFLLIAFLILLVLPLFAQEGEKVTLEKNGFFIAPLGEALLYSQTSVSYGGGFFFGYGGRGAIGLRLLYAVDKENQGVMELLFFLRYFLSSRMVNSGPFLQLNTGPVLFTNKSVGSAFDGIGTISAGLTFGWRFSLGKYWFIEPAVRAGYPYLAGAGLSAGLKI